MGEHQVCWGQKPRPELSLGFLVEKGAGQGKQVRIGQFEELWQASALGLVSSCLLPGPGTIGGRGNSVLICERYGRFAS